MQHSQLFCENNIVLTLYFRGYYLVNIPSIQYHFCHSCLFYDSNHNNILAIFEMNVAEIVGKSVVVINFKKKKESLNVIVTSGIINPDHLRNERYREIKNTP